MLSRYVRKRHYGNNKEPNPQKILYWLSWLAQQLQKKSETEFLIEKMQPDLILSNASLYLYRLILGLIVGLIAGIVIGLILGISIGVIFATFCIIVFILEANINSLTKLRDPEIKTIENLRFSWKQVQKLLVINLSIILPFTMIIGVMITSGNLISRLIFLADCYNSLMVTCSTTFWNR